MKLTDLDLCKRIAEIENYDPKMFWVERESAFRLFTGEYWNPLTNKALLFDLMLKYNIEFDRHPQQPKVGYVNCMVVIDGFVTQNGGIFFGSDDQLPRAILECIVEANHV
jgi:hypothetical protein